MQLPDLSPLLESLPKITAGRVPAGAVQDQIDDGFRVRIPVRLIAEGDKKDVSLRRYIRQWFRERLKDVRGLRMSDRFISLRPGDSSWTTSSGEVFQLAGIIEVDLHRSKEGEMDRFRRQQERKKKEAHRKFRQELTENTGGSSS